MGKSKGLSLSAFGFVVKAAAAAAVAGGATLAGGIPAFADDFGVFFEAPAGSQPTPRPWVTNEGSGLGQPPGNPVSSADNAAKLNAKADFPYTTNVRVIIEILGND